MVSPSVWTGILCPRLLCWLIVWVPFGSKKILNSSKLAVVFELSFKPPSGNIFSCKPLFWSFTFPLSPVAEGWSKRASITAPGPETQTGNVKDLQVLQWQNECRCKSACDAQLPVPVRADSTPAGTGRGAVCRGDFLAISCPPSLCKVPLSSCKGGKRRR